MATIGFSDEQLKVINSLRDKLSLNGIATIDAYHAIFFVTSTFLAIMLNHLIMRDYTLT